MTRHSPLRYPGGKATMTGLLRSIRRINGLGNRAVAEPFAGGAGASLSLLYLEETEKIFINDADRAIHDLWWALVNRSDEFLTLLSKTRVDIREWGKQRLIYISPTRVSRLQRGFATFYLNRCNRSGIIINGGPIGGILQGGKWKIDARYNKEELRRRCTKIAEYRTRINVSCEDGISFIERLDSSKTFFFIDPPYFEKGPLLYLNALDKNYHKALGEQLRTMTDTAWVLTYDDCSEIHRLYSDWATIHPFTLRYTAARRRNGRELLITPKWMHLPYEQVSNAMNW